MPKLTAVLDSLDTLDASLHELYVRGEDGKYRLDAEGVEDVSGLKSALAAQKEAVRAAKEAAAERQRQLDEIQQRQAAQQAGISEEQLEKIRTTEAEKRRPIESERDALKAEVRELRVEIPVSTAFLGAGMYEDDWALAKSELLKRFDLSDQKKPVVLDEAGNPTAQTLDEFVAAYRTKHPRRFDAQIGGGSGATRTAGGAGGAVDVTKSKAQSGMYLPV